MNLKLGSLFNQESIGLLSRDNLFSDDLYQIAMNITDPAGYTTSYGYNARWLPETITDTYNTTATNSSYRSAIGQPKTAKIANKLLLPLRPNRHPKRNDR